MDSKMSRDHWQLIESMAKLRLAEEESNVEACEKEMLGPKETRIQEQIKLALDESKRLLQLSREIELYALYRIAHG